MRRKIADLTDEVWVCERGVYATEAIAMRATEAMIRRCKVTDRSIVAEHHRNASQGKYVKAVTANLFYKSCQSEKRWTKGALAILDKAQRGSK